MLLSTVIHKYINKSNALVRAFVVGKPGRRCAVSGAPPRQAGFWRAPVCAKQCHHGMCTDCAHPKPPVPCVNQAYTGNARMRNAPKKPKKLAKAQKSLR